MRYECENQSRLLVILRWCISTLRYLTGAYLSSPLLLACFPFVFGILLGFIIGREERRGDGLSKRYVSGKEGYSIQSLLQKNFKARRENYRIVFHSMLFLKTTFFTCLQTTYNFFSRQNKFLLSVADNGNDDVGRAIVDDRQRDEVFEERVDDDEQDEETRKYLKSDANTLRESGVELEDIPKHVAVIMDGNRRYGREKYGSATRGHLDGSKTLVDFSKWCIAEGVQMLTVYAFSTENWNRSQDEINFLMRIFCKYCDELRVEALKRGIRLQVLSTDDEKIPSDVIKGFRRMVEETKQCNKFTLNICLSYGSRGEIVNACKVLTSEVVAGEIDVSDISEELLETKMLTSGCPDPDVVIRTSGEFRLSNFLLWQLAYSEMFFIEKKWPELRKDDLVSVIQTFVRQRKRRFGK